MANGTWTDGTHYTDAKGNVWTATMVGGAWTASAPNFPAAVQAAAGATYQDLLASGIDAAVAAATNSPPVQPSWLRRYWIPVGLGTAAAWVFSAPLIAGAALGAGGRYVYEKFKATQ